MVAVSRLGPTCRRVGQPENCFDYVSALNGTSPRVRSRAITTSHSLGTMQEVGLHAVGMLLPAQLLDGSPGAGTLYAELEKWT
jgi:hypothetical protein